MRVLFLIRNSEYGGVVTCTDNLINGLMRYYRLECFVAGECGEGVDRFLKKHNFFEINFISKNPISFLKNYRTLCKICKDNKITIIHCQNRIPAIYARIYCCFHRKTRYIWANHLIPAACDFFHRITTYYGKCAVAESTEGKDFLIEKLRIPEKKIKIINLGVDIDRFAPNIYKKNVSFRRKYGINEDEKVILLYGRLTPNKGHLFLLRALSNLIEYKYRIIFPGEDNTFKKEIINFSSEININDRIIFTGFVNGDELLSFADLMVLPSQNEGYPVACLEAFCMGVPVIRTKSGGFKDMEAYCAGVDYGDVEQLSKLIEQFFLDDSSFIERARFAKNNTYNFSNKKMAKEYYNLYLQIENNL